MPHLNDRLRRLRRATTKTDSEAPEINEIVVVGVATTHRLFKIIERWGQSLRCVGAFSVLINPLITHEHDTK